MLSKFRRDCSNKILCNEMKIQVSKSFFDINLILHKTTNYKETNGTNLIFPNSLELIFCHWVIDFGVFSVFLFFLFHPMFLHLPLFFVLNVLKSLQIMQTK